MSTRPGQRRKPVTNYDYDFFDLLTGGLKGLFNSGIFTFTPNHPVQQLARMEAPKNLTPEARANYNKHLQNNPEYLSLLEQISEGMMDPSQGLVSGIIKKVPSRMAKTFEELPMFDWNANIGRYMKPTEADMTITGADFLGLDASRVDPQSMYGGPMYGSLKTSDRDNLMWAYKKKPTDYLNSRADLFPIMAMMPDSHQSNTSVSNAIMAQVQAFIRDGRMTKENVTEVQNILRSSGGQSKKYTDKVLNKAEKLLSEGNSPKEVAKKLGFTTQNADKEIITRLQLKGMPDLSDAEGMENFMANATFDTRAKIISLLRQAKAEKQNVPNVNRILRETLDPSFAGMTRGSGLLISEMDKKGGVVELGPKTGTALHPSYPLALKGGNESRFGGPIDMKEMFPDFFNDPKIQAMSEADKMITFKRKLPEQEITPELAERLTSIQSLKNIQSQRQATLGMDFALENWRDSTKLKKDGGISPADFSRALRESDASSTLTLYTEKEIKDGIKDGSFKVFQLGDEATDSQIYFGLKSKTNYADEYGFQHPDLTDNEVALVGVVNNELGAKGVGGPSVLLKAIKEGATVLDAFAVPSAKYPGGFLPELYNDFGFVELGRIPFDPQFYSPQQVADLKAYWTSTGWDESMGMPEVVIMKWKGDDAIRPEASRYFIEQGGLSSGPKISGFTDSSEKLIGQRNGKNLSPTSGASGVGDTGGNSGGLRIGDRASVPQRIQGLLSETANLTPVQSQVLGISPDQINRLRTQFPSLLY